MKPIWILFLLSPFTLLGQKTVSKTGRVATFPAPQIYSQDTASRILSFIPSTGSREINLYEYSVDNGRTWKPLVEWQNARRGKDDLATSWNGRHEIFIGNGTYPAGTVQVRVGARDEQEPSPPATTTVPFSFSASFHPLKPTNIRLREVDETDRWGNRLTWTLPFGTASYTDFQITTDGGTVWRDAPFIPYYTQNQSIAAGKFGVRVVDRNSRKPLGPPAFYGMAITSYPVTIAPPVDFLRPFDATVKARTTAGSHIITLTNNHYHIQPGNQIIIGSERPDGLFLRTEQGTDITWPYWSFANLKAANDSVVAYPSAYVDGLYAYVKDSGYLIRKGSGGFEVYAPPSGSTFQYAHSRALIATVSAVNGLQLTLDQPVRLNLKRATVIFDNAPLLNNYFASLKHYAVVNIKQGRYPVAGKISTGSKIGLDIRARGVTLYSPPNVPSVQFELTGSAPRLNDYPGEGTFKVIGNYHFQGLNLTYLPKGAPYSDACLPNLNQPILTENFLNNHPIHIGAWFSRVNDIEAYNGVQYQVQTLANDVQIKGLRAGLTEMIPPTAGKVPYSELYAWGIHVTNSFNVDIDFQHDTAWTSPYWINALEAFNSSDIRFRNGIFINAMCANNGTAQVLVKNSTFIVKEGSRYFQGPGFPVWEENAYFGNPYGWQKNTFDSVRVIIEGQGVAGQNTAPIGFLMRPGSSPVRYLHTTYQRANYKGAAQGWPGQGWLVSGDGTEIRNSKAIGDFGEAYLDTYKIGMYRGSAIAVGNAGATTIIEKVQAPTFFVPADLFVASISATEKAVGKYPVVYLDKDQVVRGPSVQLNSKVVLDAGRKVVDPGTYWAVISRPAGAADPVFSCQYGADCNKTMVSGMVKGKYEFRRYVTDDTGLLGQDNVVIEVK